MKAAPSYHWATLTVDSYQSRAFGSRQVVYRTGSTEEFFKLLILDHDDYSSERGWRDFSEPIVLPDLTPVAASASPVPTAPGWWWGERRSDRSEGCIDGWRAFFVEFEPAVHGTLRRIRRIGSDDWVSPDFCTAWLPLKEG